LSCASYIIKSSLQNWRDFADVTQGVAIYLVYSSDVLLICWLGSQLTKHVRQKEWLLILLTWLNKEYYVDEPKNKLRNHITHRVVMDCLQ